MTKNNILTHDIKQVLGCRNDNYYFPSELNEYCVNNTRRPCNEHRWAILNKVITEIGQSLANGINYNDVTLMNIIRGELNKINKNNIDMIIDSLKSLKFTNENHYAMLANELIIKSMNDSVSISQHDRLNKCDMTPTDIYVNVAVAFIDFSEQNKTTEVSFKNILSQRCNIFFKGFIDENMKMDENNQHRVKNYKGFMNMIASLYCAKCFNCDIVNNCIDKITKIIVKQNNFSDIEKDNYYSGLDKLIIKLYDKFDADESNEDFCKIYEVLQKSYEMIDNVINTDKPQLRKYMRSVHAQNVSKLKKIKEKY